MIVYTALHSTGWHTRGCVQEILSLHRHMFWAFRNQHCGGLHKQLCPQVHFVSENMKTWNGISPFKHQAIFEAETESKGCALFGQFFEIHWTSFPSDKLQQV